MKRKSMSSKSWIKILVLVPVLALLGYFFSEKVTAKAESNSTMINEEQWDLICNAEDSYYCCTKHRVDLVDLICSCCNWMSVCASPESIVVLVFKKDSHFAPTGHQNGFPREPKNDTSRSKRRPDAGSEKDDGQAPKQTPLNR